MTKKFFSFGLILCVLLTGCNSRYTVFKKISSGHSGIHFNNAISENDSINPIDLEFMYNGGGVAVGDFNNDGLQDLYFTGSLVSNKLYLNRGNFEFTDITVEAKVTGEGRWSNGAAVVDINNDGWPDIYVCVTIKKNPLERTNLLYVNQGPDKNGIPVFKEMAREYGLADTSYSVQAAFFDYDNDGDLDMYLLNTKLGSRDVDRFSGNDIHGDKTDVDKLFRNDWSDSLHHPVFTDVSKEAGIVQHGYGLGIAVADLNNDGWKDLYISNDFFGSDVLLMNNRNGSFINQISHSLKHTSQSSMGNDIADVNNDGLPDIMTVDMDPADNLRKKKNMGGSNYNLYQNMIYGNYSLQYSRNTLQLNQGLVPGMGDSIGIPAFSDIGFYAGVAATDWSWNPSLADIDNDGFRDILVTNGYPKDVTDHDFAAFRRQSSNSVSKSDLLEQIPQIKISNYAFRNTGDLKFVDETKTWGLETPSFSSGAVYVDLDNDGDLDYVINNINDEAFLYENTTNTHAKISRHFLDIRFRGDSNNLNGLGALAAVYYDHGKMQVYENSPYRGYLSTVEARAHFGLGSVSVLDSVVVKWPSGKKQILLGVPADTLIQVNIKNASLSFAFNSLQPPANTLFTETGKQLGIHYFHLEADRNDFSKERLLPHKLSQYGPALAVGDIDKNGFDDIFIGGSDQYPGKFLMQQSDGTFSTRELPTLPIMDRRNYKNMGVLLFDADNDGNPDLYCVSGSNEFTENGKNYQDILLVNDGKGNFSPDTAALPVNFTSKSCIKAADINNDGKPDLFIGGRVLPGRYPTPVSSFIYRNDSDRGHIKFTDVTASIAPALKDIGLVCDAVWTDYDNDGWIDLIVVGEWMPVTIFHNNHGKMEKLGDTGIGSAVGWWNSITAGDFDNDGDIDYIVGNLGQNSFYQASDSFPVSIYAADFDNNGSLDAIPTLYLPDGKGHMKEFPAQSRDEIMAQLPYLKKKFLSYKEFGDADINSLFSAEELEGAVRYHVNELRSMYMENLGNGKFRMHALPKEAQLAPVYGLVVDDFNHDGNLDIAMAGNDFGTEVTNGRYDAMNGLVLLGDGRGNFESRTIAESGFFIPGDAKALIKLEGHDGNYLLAGSQNKNTLKIFKANSHQLIIRLKPGDRYALITEANNKTRREEVYWGSSFLSQSSGFISVNPGCKKIEIFNDKTGKREER